MKSFIILATLLLATTAFADQAYMKLGDIKGEAKDTESLVVEGDLMNGVIDNEENAAEEVQDRVHQPSGSSTGQARRRGDVKMEDISVTKELDKSSTRAQDYNSSRSNRRGDEKLSTGQDETHTTFPSSRDAASGLATGKRQHRPAIDTDDDGDSVDTVHEIICNSVDNDCDDTTTDEK